MRRTSFTTIKTEGGLLPPDFLQRLVTASSDVPGLTPAAYHLAGTEKLNEAASRAWNRLLGIWTSFQATNVPETDPGTTITREKWLLPLFSELGYGRLQPARALEINGRSYPVSHAWQNVPVHLVGRNIDLDHRTAGVAGAARTSPHGLVQELLNCRVEALWGFVSNGLKLRLLRDNHSITRQAYVEFDLAAMMDGQAFSDFVLLWLLCHQSRVETEPGGMCWLEKWATAAREQGTRALDELRDGVERAIEALGRGFLKHPANRTLLEKLRAGTLDRQDYYRQLLRLVYRLIFLLVAEARELLLVAEPTSATAERYRRYYSITRLRGLAGSRRGTPHGDLWQSLLVVIRGLSSSHGCSELGLPALGSLLWSDAAAPDLNSCQLSNLDLLNAIRALGFRIERGMRRTVDWRNLGAEELGSVYESLLELHPDVNSAAATFSLRVAAGHERKTTGSYYTPTSLVECLLDSALDPVLDQAAKAPDPEGAILHLRVCDPACGSGHFLIAAAHRIARRLAAVQTGDSEASPEAVRRALREVIGHCLYGVDMNPMAVELCKVNLWLEALEPGKPLSFLEHHIQCGNSLLGATPTLLAKGIPDEAFAPIEGDDKEICKEFKRINRDERNRQARLFGATTEPWQQLGNLAVSLANLESIGDDSFDGICEKQRLYEQTIRSSDYLNGRFWADSWCAAFVWKKTREFNYPITEEVFRRIEHNPHSVDDWVRNETQRLAGEYQFFHWHLAFPDVFHVPSDRAPENEQTGWSGGFDCVIGNPPWERLKIQEKEWFSRRYPEIANAKNASSRRERISQLKVADPSVFAEFINSTRRAEGEGQLVRETGRFPLCGLGDVNTYAVFAETYRMLMNIRGQAGFIVPSGIATDDTTKAFFGTIVEKHELVALYDFENRENLFRGVGHGRMKFVLVTLGKADLPRFGFQLWNTQQLADPERVFTMSADDIRCLNPNTRTCPIFRSRRESEITKFIYRRIPILLKEDAEPANPWHITFLRMFDMSNDAASFRTAGTLEADGFRLMGNVYTKTGGERFLPLYEAKMAMHFDHRYGTYAGRHESRQSTALDTPSAQQHDNPDFVVLPRYWLSETDVHKSAWLLSFRRISHATNDRTFISHVLPRAAVADSIFCVESNYGKVQMALLANFCSFVFDFVVRQKMGGLNLNYFIVKQLPVLTPETYDQACSWMRGPANGMSILQFIESRVRELTYTAWELEGFERDCDSRGTPFRWNEGRRFLLRCELDATFFHLYLPSDANGHWRESDIQSSEDLALVRATFARPRDAVAYIMDTFPIVRRKDEEKHNGDYRTKRVVLEVYDAITESVRTGRAYQTRLDPPPADPSCRHPKKKLGILAFGSLIHNPGSELEPRIVVRFKTQTPFPVEYGRYSKKRGGGPTLVPHENGACVSAEILILDDKVDLSEARDMLWRRETGNIGSGKAYPGGQGPNSVVVQENTEDPCVSMVLYTDFHADGKVANPEPAELATRAIASAKAADPGQDGISYLVDAMNCGIETPVTQAYRDAILQKTNTASLEEALGKARNGSD